MTICATILTGHRPDLLAVTLGGALDYLRRCDHVIVFHNGGDAETAAVLDGCGIEHERMTRDWDMLPNGPATSACALAAKRSGCELWWHVEDDWLPVPELVERHPTWFDDAQEIALNPSIGQVRLREEAHLGRIVTLPEGMVGDGSGSSNTNWIDGRLVAWQSVREAPFMVGAHHLTFNPMVMRASLIGDGTPEKPGEPLHGVFPAETERHAMARFYAANLLVAQLRPGIFRHIGEGRHVGQH
jgi:hypothetical protein